MSRPRRQRREKARALRKDVRRLEALADKIPGGSAATPIVVTAASTIETKARAARCVRCERELDLLGEDTTVVPGGVLRRVDTACRACHAHRSLWFLIAHGATAN
ncbi:MAG TPA: hypothetical protein VH374_22920 [Polyangia bacterium]|jgi:hypothetical protein|nr:hypothetical protein [Polyangia bacterium]